MSGFLTLALASVTGTRHVRVRADRVEAVDENVNDSMRRGGVRITMFSGATFLVRGDVASILSRIEVARKMKP